MVAACNRGEPSGRNTKHGICFPIATGSARFGGRMKREAGENPAQGRCCNRREARAFTPLRRTPREGCSNLVLSRKPEDLPVDSVLHGASDPGTQAGQATVRAANASCAVGPTPHIYLPGPAGRSLLCPNLPIATAGPVSHSCHVTCLGSSSPRLCSCLLPRFWRRPYGSFHIRQLPFSEMTSPGGMPVRLFPVPERLHRDCSHQPNKSTSG